MSSEFTEKSIRARFFHDFLAAWGSISGFPVRSDNILKGHFQDYESLKLDWEHVGDVIEAAIEEQEESTAR